jgi:hypothetical protein
MDFRKYFCRAQKQDRRASGVNEMSRDEIKQTIDDFLLLVEKGCGSVEENEAKLKLLLDKLAFAQHSINYKFDEKDYADAPRKKYDELRKLVTAQFPNYGYYNVAEDVTINIGEGKVNVGDAIDDIADMAGDLFEAKWCWENNSTEDGLWHFKNEFEIHWNNHLRGLQIYLINLERGT